jgi:biopolymer transport protein ExbD
MKKRRGRILPRADINVTPLIDILLVLLVIFMTISPTMPTGVNANIPQDPPIGPRRQEPEKAIILSMDRNGVIRINQTEVEASHLVEQLKDIFKTRNDRTIFVQADDDLLFNDVAQLIDAAKGAGVERLGLMTEQLTAGEAAQLPSALK